MKNTLSQMVRAQAEALSDSIERNALDVHAASDHAELLRVLARILEGKSADAAFGAPGDWGYNHPIGKAVFAMLKEPKTQEAVTRQDLIRALETGHDALTQCLRCFLQTGPTPDPSVMARASAVVSSTLKKARAS